MTKIELMDGKYTYINHKDGRQEALRYGEPWRDLVGDKFVHAMAEEIESLIAKLVELQEENARLREDAERNSAQCDELLRAVFQVCEATEELAPSSDFERGRVFEAKGIREAIGTWFQDTFCGKRFMGEPAIDAVRKEQK